MSNVPKMFGSLVFNETVMKDRLPTATYKTFKNAVLKGEALDLPIANIIANATFPLFTSGLEKFDKAVADGTLTYVVGTNLTYRMPELLTRDWYVDVDVSKYAAYFVVALNHDMSVSSIIDPIKKIEALLAKRS